MRINPLIGCAFVLGVAICGSQTAKGDETAAVEVKPLTDSPTSGIQEAIDSLSPGGGVVTIPAGVYLLRQSIRLRDGMTLQGRGEATVLRKNKQFGSKLKDTNAGKTIQVRDASGFRAGDEIGLFDRTSVGWLHGHGVIVEVKGNELVLNKNPGAKFDPANGAAVVNYFPAISGRDMSRVVVKDLTIDGQAAANAGPHLVSERPKGTPPDLGFTFAAIDLIRVADSRVENVRVKGWPADGISVQGQGASHGKYRGNVVTKCYVENCRGPGYHAGGRLEDSEFTDNEGRGNLGDGFYFCAWVTRVAVRNNKFIANRGSGVGGLGDSGDRDNVVEGNTCEANGKCGVQLWDGAANIVKNNTCINNSQSSPGTFSGISLATTTSSIVTGNRCFDNQPRKTQKHGIEETPNCRANSVMNNETNGNASAGLALLGKEGQYSGNRQ